ncbi:hypothetical protein MNV49_007105 [Pseudohyphozyma bogoriensis]|nr:hypothetical protein MNV49_007105 [Pseudohyphozyma bogoriensis]
MDYTVLRRWRRVHAGGSEEHVGLLEVETKRRDDEETYIVVVRDGMAVSEGVARTKRSFAGTTVTVRDIFYKWPVRRRPLTTPAARLNLITALKSSLSTLTLLHPEISFTLTDTSDESAGAKRLVAVARSKEGVLGRWRQLWGRAGVENVVEIIEKEGGEEEIELEGFFSLTASHSKASQYIFVNSRPLSSSSFLQKLINATFSQSTFARHATSHLATSPLKSNTGTKASRKSPKKVIERHPIFVINLKAPSGMVDVTLEPEKRVVEFLDPTRIHSFVEKDENSNDAPLEWFDPSTGQKYMVDPRTGNSWRPGCGAADLEAARERERECEGCRSDTNGREEDRVKKRNLGLVDRSTLKRKLGGEGEEKVPEWISKTFESWENPVFPRAQPNLRSLDTSLDLAPLLQAPQQQRVSDTKAENYNPSRSDRKLMDTYFRSPALLSDLSADGGMLDREDLKRARFIAQVETKFLLVAISPKGSEAGGGRKEELLVMIDQHAASERVRVEKYLKEICGEVRVWTFEEPVGVVVSGEEAKVIRDRKGEFEKWGLRIEVALPELEKGEGDESTSYVQVHLHAVPLLVADRLRAEPRLQQELVRSYVAQLVDEKPGGVTGEETWVGRARKCPPVLLDLVNSKACRGAIMFNDALTPEQSTTLIAQLADTTFPFQCAHGRPSLMPLGGSPTLSDHSDASGASSGGSISVPPRTSSLAATAGILADNSNAYVERYEEEDSRVVRPECRHEEVVESFSQPVQTDGGQITHDAVTLAPVIVDDIFDIPKESPSPDSSLVEISSRLHVKQFDKQNKAPAGQRVPVPARLEYRSETPSIHVIIITQYSSERVLDVVWLFGVPHQEYVREQEPIHRPMKLPEFIPVQGAPDQAGNSTDSIGKLVTEMRLEAS